MESAYQILLYMLGILFVLGMITFLTGILILARRATGKEIQTLANQTARLVQKGLAEEVAGLVGNATTLLDTLNQLMRTTAGIGIFLTLLGLFMMALACWVAVQLFRTNL